ncbi:hypothetical protein N9K77_01290 [bacterium]|nr:hypothetical protein [bacterium]
MNGTNLKLRDFNVKSRSRFGGSQFFSKKYNSLTSIKICEQYRDREDFMKCLLTTGYSNIGAKTGCSNMDSRKRLEQDVIIIGTTYVGLMM